MQGFGWDLSERILHFAKQCWKTLWHDWGPIMQNHTLYSYTGSMNIYLNSHRFIGLFFLLISLLLGGNWDSFNGTRYFWC